MLKNVLAIIPVIVFVCASVATAQHQSAISDDWEQYKVSDHGFSFMFPRSPVKTVDDSQECAGRNTVNHSVYVDRVVYMMSVTHKVSPPKECSSRMKFSAEDFTNRLEFFQGSKKETVPEKIKGAYAAQYRSDTRLTRTYNDPKNDRWFELAVMGKFAGKPDIDKFLDSLSVSKTLSGIEVGEGWNNVQMAINASIGAPPAENRPVGTGGPGAGIGNKPDAKGTESPGGIGSRTRTATPPTGPSSPVVIVAQPKPPYTQEARKAQEQGTVILKVIFNANRRVGSVTVVRGLGYGLTEHAIAAAKRIVFIPAERAGFNYTVAKTMHYSFSIY